MSDDTRLADLQRRMADELAAADDPTAALDARLLLAHASRLTETELALKANEPVSAAIVSAAMTLTDLRKAGKPIAKIIGVKEFWGRAFRVGAAVLDPRPDSETLIESALAILPDKRDLKLLDLGTGSGCLILTLLAERPNARGLAVDKSRAALRIARLNAHRLGLRARASMRTGDWLAGIAGHKDMRFDMIVSNPPYIARDELSTLAPDVQFFDPRAALDGGADGLSAYRLLIAPAMDCLNEGGYLVLEIGATQAEAVSAMMQSAGFQNISVRQDLADRDRVVLGQR